MSENKQKTNTYIVSLNRLNTPKVKTVTWAKKKKKN